MKDAEAVAQLSMLRPGTEDDAAFIYQTWLNGLYHGNDFFGLIKRDRFFKVYHAILDVILKRPDTEVRVVCLNEDPSVILGYSVLCPKALHWIYLKKSWRGFGLARKLIPEHITTCTHITHQGAKLMPKGWEFDPFL